MRIVPTKQLAVIGAPASVQWSSGAKIALIRDLYSRAAAPRSEDDAVEPRHACHLVLPASDERGERFALVVSVNAIQRLV